MRRALVLILVTRWSVTLAAAQSPLPADSLARFLQFEDASPLSCLFTYFPSFFIQNGIEMKNFIRSKTFLRIRREFGDRRAADAIYVRAMQMTNNNTAVALLLSAIACFDHRLVGINVPIFNLYLPLSNESEEEFTRRVRHLPTRLYDDTPSGEGGDRDKLQHFFGSAFLAFVFESGGTATRFGEFVEEGEGAIIIGGVNDDRDLRADNQGKNFGMAALEDNRIYPSHYFKTPRAVRDGSAAIDVPLCTGVW